jgi:hypothetical protein
MELTSNQTQERKKGRVARGDDICPSLVCACERPVGDKTGHYKPSRFQVQEHCTKRCHTRCPIQRTVYALKE